MALPRATRRLVITADDFGLHPAVNRAVARAHDEGVLSAASLMMGAPATAEAVILARQRSNLRIGLHVMVADGFASAPPAGIPAIAMADGTMDNQVIARSFRFVRPAVVEQLRREIGAQFAAYENTGLALDHVNVHKHLHMHPVVLRLVIDAARAHGCRSLRIPWEPPWVAALTGTAASRLGTHFLNGWARMARGVAVRAGMSCNDTIFGVTHSGHIGEDLMLRFLAGLPPGLSEIYLHPADHPEPINASMRGYRPQDELQALLSPPVRRAVEEAGVTLGGYQPVIARPG